VYKVGGGDGWKMAKKTAKRAVSPVLATLMMVAVAVALSVIIFTWSQSFLSQTGEAASGQQAAQNIAAQSGILIESATFATSSSGSATITVRNVGAVSVTLGTAIATGRPDNSGFKTSNTGTPATLSLSKGDATTISFSLSGLQSGDVITFKVTTKAGTFAQATYTVP